MYIYCKTSGADSWEFLIISWQLTGILNSIYFASKPPPGTPFPTIGLMVVWWFPTHFFNGKYLEKMAIQLKQTFINGWPSGSERPEKRAPKTGCLLGFFGCGISQRIRSYKTEDSEILHQHGKYFIVYRVWYIPGRISSVSSTKAGLPEGRFNHQPEKKSSESRFPVNTSILLIDKKIPLRCRIRSLFIGTWDEEI